MALDRKVCSQARLARDARFDGKFFIGVLTSRVYCRPICPARTAKEQNVRYYASAAAAAEAGFRPCLRCRPECSPGTPAWMGTSSTVSRALRLISESPLESGGVDGLAERLGVGSRHLRRLFWQHLGASPVVVAQTRRLHFAKKLIDETELPMGQVAFAAGFGSVRRFNAAFRGIYRRTPTQIRRLARAPLFELEDEYTFRLAFRPPYHWDALLAFLAPRATPGTELVEGGQYRRTISLNGCHGFLEVSCEANRSALTVHVHFREPRWFFMIMERVRGMFDLNADCHEIGSRLSADPELAKRVARSPGLRLPGSWDGFELATRAILGQQVTVKGATTLAGRLVRSFGTPVAAWKGLTHVFPSPEVLADARLTSIGLPKARAETIRALAQAVCDGRISFAGIVNSETFLARLRELPGIGDWTAQYVAMRALGEPDAFPSSDLGLLRATALRSFRQLEKRAEAWKPWRAYAAMYLWQEGKVADPRPMPAAEAKGSSEYAQLQM